MKLSSSLLVKTDSRETASWSPQYQTLDHWRVIAALWVMMFHGFGTLYEKTLHPTAEVIKRIAQPGWLGVHLFFVISGYCIAASIYRSLNTGQASPGLFLVSRAKRLLPVYWLAFLTALIINLLASPFNSSSLGDNLHGPWQSWVGNLFLIQPYIDVPYYVVVYWSLVVEIGFYLIVSGLLLLNQRTGCKAALSAGLILGLISIFIPSDFGISAIALWSEFLCGVLAFAALLGQHRDNIRLRNASLFILAIFFISGSWSQFSLDVSRLWFSALFSLILFFAYPLDRKISNISSLNWLRTTGLMSYSLYLLHVPLQGRVVNLSTRFIAGDSPYMFLVQIVGWAVAIAVSYLFFRTVEKPLNDWRRQKKSIRQI